MFKFNRLLTSLLFGFFFISGVEARLPFYAFKGVSNKLKNPFYSPVLGIVGLESGILKSIRFSFVEKELYDKRVGNRIFVDDDIKYPHGLIAKILFPSATGEVSINTSGVTNFANNSDIVTIANLMIFSSKVRHFIDSLPQKPDSKTLKRWAEMKLIALLKLPNLKEITVNLVNEYKEKMKPIVGGKAYAEGGKSKMNYDDEVTYKLLINVIQAILLEKSGSGFLPEYSVEQIISAFVCEKLDTIKQLREYLTVLYNLDHEHLIFNDLSHIAPDKRFSDVANFKAKEMTSVLESLSQMHDASHSTLPPLSSSSRASSSSGASSSSALATHSHHTPSLDVLYALFVMPNFTSETPYVNQPPSHGPCGFVSNVNESVVKSGTFSDCNENSLRVLLNLMIFNPKSRNFNLAFLDTLTGGRIEKLKEFLEIQPVSAVNTGAQITRTAWNRVVGDLNSVPEILQASSSAPASSSSSAPASSSESSFAGEAVHAVIGEPVRYIQGDNELDSGFANVLRVFEKVLNKPLLPRFPENDIKEQEEAIKTGFMTLFSIIAPERKVTLTFKGLQKKDGQKDLAGSMIVNVDGAFQFTLLENPGSHGHIEGVRSLKAVKKKFEAKRLATIDKFQSSLNHGVLQTFYLLNQPTKKKTINDFYQLFSKPIDGNNDVIEFLWKLNKRSNFVLPLRHALTQVAWDDEHTRSMILLDIKSLLSIREYQKVLSEKVGFFQTSPEYPLEFVLDKLPNVQYLESDSSAFTKEMPKLKSLTLTRNVSHLPNLDFFPALKKLNLTMSSIKDVPILKPMPYLTEIVFPYDLSMLPDLNNLPMLEKLNLKSVRLESISINGNLQKLKSIEIPIKVKTVEINGNFPELVDLSLADYAYTHEYDRRSLDNLISVKMNAKMKRLAKLNIAYSVTSLVLKGKYPSLLELTVGNIQSANIDKAVLKGIKTFVLPKTVKRFPNLTQYRSLERLDISQTQLDKLSISSPLPTVKFLALSKNFNEAPDLNYFPALEELDLSETSIDIEQITAPLLKIKKLILPRYLTILPDLRNFPNLEFLNMSNTSIVSADFKVKMKKLKDVSFPYGLQHLSGVHNLPGLENLSGINISFEIEGPMPHLKQLSYHSSREPNWAYLPRLEGVNLSMAPLEHITFNAPLRNLKGLTLPRTLKSMPKLAELPSLTHLYLYDCMALTRVDIDVVMPHLTLIELPASGTVFNGTGKLPALEDLNGYTHSGMPLDLNQFPSLKLLTSQSKQLEVIGKESDWKVILAFYTRQPHERYIKNPNGVKFYKNLAEWRAVHQAEADRIAATSGGGDESPHHHGGSPIRRTATSGGRGESLHHHGGSPIRRTATSGGRGESPHRHGGSPIRGAATSGDGSESTHHGGSPIRRIATSGGGE